MFRSATIIAFAASLATSTAYAQEGREVNSSVPAPDCHARVNYNLNAMLPGYTDADGICQPFRGTYSLVPDGYAGSDYYGDEFTDAKIRERWKTCREDEACRLSAMKSAWAFTQSETQDTGSVDAFGKIDPEGTVDLSRIRRPAYFGAEPFEEPIGAAEDQTFTVEFTVPRDRFEKQFLGKKNDIKLRGWYLRGKGVSGGTGAPQRALVIMNNGGGNEITAIDQRGFEGVVYDPDKDAYVHDAAADGASEEPGMRNWRGFIADLNRAGFDVLVTDRRGNGISGGQHGYDTAEQGTDMFRELDQLRTGDGLRVLTPDGKTLSGEDAVDAIYADDADRDMPVVLGGYSRGSYAVGWAMTKNFVEDCDYGLPEPQCEPARGNQRIKGAILYGPNAGGVGYRNEGEDLQEAALRTEFNTTYRLDSSVFKTIGQWPAVTIIKGTWGYPESLEGSFTAFQRASEPKDIFVFHGPHQLETQAPENMKAVGERMVAFAKAAVTGMDHVPGALHPASLKDLVLSAPPFWELTTKPQPAENGKQP